MEFHGDISGLDELERQIEDVYFNRLIEIGREAIRIAHNASGTKEYPRIYQNHTWNLRNAPGFCVVRNGKIIALEVYGKGSNMEAVQNTTYYLQYHSKEEDGLYLADGMNYASFVQSKGFDVLDSAIQYAKRMVKKKIF
ncbi:hypothetical protein [Phocaeicola massiliensis]|jgi:hypothetical protein|uniref:Uncharacterized protein n=1 Tax=Siphoviridae sp. ctvBz3 TaxID=2825720 RepID=A0A8S5TXH5_9CAUD|nr:hypothetical protein [Phocaeicola massiliensis]DAF86910.1 MAG TPA: hypothetical protein [Siphoviridae sp. ctvBz3]DAS82368.1 MAG TPA: hypothetical protein [Bacteriophage sp.]